MFECQCKLEIHSKLHGLMTHLSNPNDEKPSTSIAMQAHLRMHQEMAGVSPKSAVSWELILTVAFVG